MSDAGDTYGGLLGSFRYSFGASDSRIYKGYVLVSAVLGLAVTLLFVLALVGVIGATRGASQTTLFVRAFFVIIALLVLVPILAPVLLVAHRHRTRPERNGVYDTALAGGGYLFIGALYLGLVISVPPERQESVTGAFGAIVDTLYGLPQLLGLVPPILAVLVIGLLHRRFR